MKLLGVTLFVCVIWAQDIRAQKMSAELAAKGPGEKVNVIVQFNAPPTLNEHQMVQRHGGIFYRDLSLVKSGAYTLSAAELQSLAAEPSVAHISEDHIEPRPNQNRQAHVGVHAQSQSGLFYIGVVLPVGKMMANQMRALAAIARDCGDGDIRLTVWQNFLISGIPEARLVEAQGRIEAIGLDWKASSIRAGLIACTGSRGCRFSASDTKGHAEDIARWCEPRVTLDQPINIHLTGCHNSCAQHYIGDIGLIGARVAINEDGDTVDGYHIFVGGGFGAQGEIGREIFHDVKADAAPEMVERLLKTYLANRASPAESFHQFTASCDVAVLKRLAQKVVL